MSSCQLTKQTARSSQVKIFEYKASNVLYCDYSYNRSSLDQSCSYYCVLQWRADATAWWLVMNFELWNEAQAKKYKQKPLH